MNRLATLWHQKCATFAVVLDADVASGESLVENLTWARLGAARNVARSFVVFVSVFVRPRWWTVGVLFFRVRGVSVVRAGVSSLVIAVVGATMVVTPVVAVIVVMSMWMVTAVPGVLVGRVIAVVRLFATRRRCSGAARGRTVARRISFVVTTMGHKAPW